MLRPAIAHPCATAQQPSENWVPFVSAPLNDRNTFRLNDVVCFGFAQQTTSLSIVDHSTIREKLLLSDGW